MQKDIVLNEGVDGLITSFPTALNHGIEAITENYSKKLHRWTTTTVCIRVHPDKLLREKPHAIDYQKQDYLDIEEGEIIASLRITPRLEVQSPFPTC